MSNAIKAQVQIGAVVITQQIEGSRLTSLDSRYVLRISIQASSSTLSSITVCIP